MRNSRCKGCINWKTAGVFCGVGLVLLIGCIVYSLRPGKDFKDTSGLNDSSNLDNLNNLDSSTILNNSNRIDDLSNLKGVPDYHKEIIKRDKEAHAKKEIEDKKDNKNNERSKDSPKNRNTKDKKDNNENTNDKRLLNEKHNLTWKEVTRIIDELD